MLVRMFLAALLAAAASAQPAYSSSDTQQSVFQQVDEMTSALSEITGWKIERKVPSEMLSKDKFRHYVDSKMKGSSREQLRIEEITLKMFGFVPRDYDLAKEMVDLVSEQAAAFYDYNKKRLFIIDSTSEGMEQRVALAHELAHALADQHHPLGKYLHKGSPDDDASTARQAVMEGQATWLTWAYMSKRSGGKGEIPAEMLDELSKSMGSDGADFPVFTKAPLYMKESLVFPYNQGLRFQDAVFRKLGREGFDQVFAHPPASTQQILHPDIYMEGRKPTEPDAPALEDAIGKKAAKRYKVLAEGVLGEFDFSVLLRQYVDEKEGAAAASHWRGAAYRIYENKDDKSHLLTYRAEWDSPEAAQKFAALYRRVMQGRSKTFQIQGSDSDSTGVGDSGRFHLSVRGEAVESIEGLR
jgi:hypothetical protein